MSPLQLPQSVLSPPASVGTLIYEPFYGLKAKPFSLSCDPRYLYRSPAHATAFDELLRAIRRREGLIVLTGDIGTGKTTLCRAVLEKLDRQTFTAFVPDPFVSREDLLKMLLIDFGVMSVDDLRSGRLQGVSRPDLSYPLYEFLKSLQPLRALAVLIIDEAQNIPPPLLEEIRILSDLEDREKLLQVVFAGQLELRANLKLPKMRQLDQRVSVRCDLGPLSCESVGEYIRHRLLVAGRVSHPPLFSRAAVDEIYKASRGVPRVINLICDRALQRGYDQQTPRIGQDLVIRAVLELDLGTLVPPPSELVSPNAQPAIDPPRLPPVNTVTVAKAPQSPGEVDLQAFPTESELDASRPFTRKEDNLRDPRSVVGDITAPEFYRKAARGTGLDLKMRDRNEVTELDAEPENLGHVLLRRAAGVVALLMLVVVLAWGSWQVWLAAHVVP